VTIGMMMTKTKEPYGMKPMNTDKLFWMSWFVLYSFKSGSNSRLSVSFFLHCNPVSHTTCFDCVMCVWSTKLSQPYPTMIFPSHPFLISTYRSSQRFVVCAASDTTVVISVDSVRYGVYTKKFCRFSFFFVRACFWAFDVGFEGYRPSRLLNWYQGESDV
jgi:hypothetical protein